MEFLLRQLQNKSLLSICCRSFEPAFNSASSLIHGTLGKALFHTTNVSMAMPRGPKKWPIYNKKMFPPQLPGEEKRPAVG